jgi:RecB family exonuclease
MMTFSQCPKKYFYEYILKLKAEPQYPAYGDLGSRAHKVLEDFYRYVTIPCDPESNFNDLLGRLYVHEFADVEDYKFNMHTGLLNFLRMEIDRYDSLEDKYLFVPKYNELYIKSEIDGIKFSGRIDAIYEDQDGKLTMVDFKFTNKNTVGADQKQQATIYTILLKNSMDIDVDFSEFWFLRHSPYKRAVKQVKITNELIKNVERKVYNTLQEIEEMNFPRKQSYLCRFCGYEGICLTERSMK